MLPLPNNDVVNDKFATSQSILLPYLLSSGVAHLFHANTGDKSSVLRQMEIRKRVAIKDLELRSNEHLLLENQNVVNVPNRCTGLLCTYFKDKNKVWKLGVLVLQTTKAMAIADAFVDDQVCYLLVIILFIILNVDLLLSFI